MRVVRGSGRNGPRVYRLLDLRVQEPPQGLRVEGVIPLPDGGSDVVLPWPLAVNFVQERLCTTDFANHDQVRAHRQSDFDKITERDLPSTSESWGPGLVVRTVHKRNV